MNKLPTLKPVDPVDVEQFLIDMGYSAMCATTKDHVSRSDLRTDVNYALAKLRDRQAAKPANPAPAVAAPVAPKPVKGDWPRGVYGEPLRLGDCPPHKATAWLMEVERRIESLEAALGHKP